MLQTLLPLLPQSLTRDELLFAIGGLSLGLALWLAGASFSRTFLALLACIGGGAIAYQTPSWFNWPVDPLATCVAGALFLGLLGYLLHQYLAALGMGSIFALWAALILMGVLGAGPRQAWPDFQTAGGLKPFLIDVYHQLPVKDAQLLPWLALMGFLGGTTLGVLWNRVSVVLLWSMAGISLILGPAMAAARCYRPDYLTFIPQAAWTQAIIISALVAFGAIFQWRAVPASEAPGPARPPFPTPQPRSRKAASGKSSGMPTFNMEFDE